MKSIKVGMLPGRLEEYTIEAGTTIQQVIELAGLDTNGFEVKANGATVSDLSQEVGEGVDRVLLVKKIKGNSELYVKVGMLPGRLEEYTFEEGTTIAEAINTAELDTTGYEVKVNGSTVTDLEEVMGQDVTRILLVKKVKGNK